MTALRRDLQAAQAHIAALQQQQQQAQIGVLGPRIYPQTGFTAAAAAGAPPLAASLATTLGALFPGPVPPPPPPSRQAAAVAALLGTLPPGSATVAAPAAAGRAAGSFQAAQQRPRGSALPAASQAGSGGHAGSGETMAGLHASRILSAGTPQQPFWAPAAQGAGNASIADSSLAGAANRTAALAADAQAQAQSRRSSVSTTGGVSQSFIGERSQSVLASLGLALKRPTAAVGGAGGFDSGGFDDDRDLYVDHHQHDAAAQGGGVGSDRPMSYTASHMLAASSSSGAQPAAGLGRGAFAAGKPPAGTHWQYSSHLAGGAGQRQEATGSAAAADASGADTARSEIDSRPLLPLPLSSGGSFVAVQASSVPRAAATTAPASDDRYHDDGHQEDDGDASAKADRELLKTGTSASGSSGTGVVADVARSGSGGGSGAGGSSSGASGGMSWAAMRASIVVPGSGFAAATGSGSGSGAPSQRLPVPFVAPSPRSPSLYAPAYAGAPAGSFSHRFSAGAGASAGAASTRSGSSSLGSTSQGLRHW